MPAKIYKQVLNDNYVKYKIKEPNLNQILQILEFIMGYIAINYSNFYVTETLLIFWDLRNCFSFHYSFDFFIQIE
jgi:hypothetical protein